MKITKSKMESILEALTSKNTWLAVVIEFGIIFLIYFTICLFGTDVIVLALLLILFIMFAFAIKELLDDYDSRK